MDHCGATVWPRIPSVWRYRPWLKNRMTGFPLRREIRKLDTSSKGSVAPATRKIVARKMDRYSER